MITMLTFVCSLYSELDNTFSKPCEVFKHTRFRPLTLDVSPDPLSLITQPVLVPREASRAATYIMTPIYRNANEN